MKFFPHLEEAMLNRKEDKGSTAVRVARVWPSEASAELYDKRKNQIAGRCHRRSYFRMIGEQEQNKTDFRGLMKFFLGDVCEALVVDLTKAAGIHVANGVRIYSDDIQMSFELDLVVKDPTTNQGIIVENKSYSSFVKAQDLKAGKPALDNSIQALLYLNEVRTGAALKLWIQKCIEEKAKAEAAGDFQSRFAKFQYTPENVESLDDGPLIAKLVYEDRAECSTFEFEMAMWEDPFDGLHYPQIDGSIWKLFAVESVYERYKTLQAYWEAARDQAMYQLDSQGVREPPYEDKEAFDAYWERLGKELRNLPSSYWPPAEYEWSYSKDKIETLWKEGLLGKTKYNEYRTVLEGRNRKPRPLPRIGDWQCEWCNYLPKCAAVEYPQFADISYDLIQIDPLEEAA